MTNSTVNYTESELEMILEKTTVEIENRLPYHGITPIRESNYPRINDQFSGCYNLGVIDGNGSPYFHQGTYSLDPEAIAITLAELGGYCKDTQSGIILITRDNSVIAAWFIFPSEAED